MNKEKKRHNIYPLNNVQKNQCMGSANGSFFQTAKPRKTIRCDKDCYCALVYIHASASHLKKKSVLSIHSCIIINII